jgi:uncharacterized RmlC-like cupin family protein
MTLLLRLVEFVSRIYSSTLTTFSEIFLAVNQRELSPAPVIPGSWDEFINPNSHAAGISGAYSTLKLKKMKKGLRILYAGMMITLLSLVGSGVKSQNAYIDAGLQEPTVTTDKEEYQPGDIAHITGSGWTLDQQIHVELKETPDYPDSHIYDVNVNADGTWQIDYPIEARHLGVMFNVLATGSESGFLASCIFYDNVTFTVGGAAAAVNRNVSSDFTLSGAQSIGDIRINEGNGNPQKSDFATSFNQFVLTLSSGYTFVQTGIVVTKSGADISSVGPPVVTSNTITVSVSVTATSTNDFITIAGVNVKPVSGNTIPNSGTIRISWTGGLAGQTSPVTLVNLSQVAGAPAQLAFVQQPTDALLGANIPAFTVQLKDQFGNNDITSNTSVTLSANNSGIISGTNPKNANSGVVTYNNISVTPAGTYQLTASSAGLTSATSSSFDILKPATSLLVTPVTAIYGATVTLVAKLTSGGGNLSGKTVSFSINGVGVGSATTNGSGNATLTNVSLVGTNAGTYASGITASFAEETGYAGTSATGSLTINPRAITVTPDALSKVYGEDDPVFTYTPSQTLLAGNSFSGTLSRDPGENVATSPYNYTIGDLSAGSNYTVTIAAANTNKFSITARAITVTPNALSKIYGNADPTFTYTPSESLISGNSFTGALSRDPGENVATSPYNYTIGDLSAGSNYTVTIAAANTNKFSITARAITVTPNALSKIYGNPDPTFTYTPSESLISGNSFTGALSRDPGENVATSPYNYTIGDLSAGSNYTVTITAANTNKFSITARAITVTPNALSKIYGNADPTFTYTPSESLISGNSFTGALSRDPGENVATSPYDYTIGDLSAGSNYTVTIAAANTNKFSITARAITVTPNALSKIYGNADPTFTYTPSESLISGNSFTGALSRDPGENVATSPYDYTIGDLSAGSNYTVTIAAANTNKFSITARAITITPDALSKVYGNADPATFTYTPSEALLSGNSFTGALSRVAGENVATSPYNYTIGDLSAGSNYTVSIAAANTNKFSITARAITVTPNALSKIYGNADPTFTYTPSESLISGNSFTGALSRDPGENVATSPYNYTIGDLSAGSNYTVSIAAANTNKFSITARAITVTPNALSKIYGNADPTFTYTPSESLISGNSFTGALSRDPGENVATSPYNYTIGDLSAGSNYTVTIAAANSNKFSITARAITVTPNALSKIYGNADPTFTYTPSESLISGNSFTGALSRDPGENVATSPYNYTIGDLSAGSNYTVTIAAANTNKFSITARAITVTPDALSKVYGNADPATFTYTPSEALLSGNSFTGALSRVAGENVASSPYNYTIGTLSAGSNYSVTINPANTNKFSITAKAITVTPNALSKIYGNADPTFTYTPSVALLSGNSFTGALSRDPGENVAGSPYNYTIGTLSAGSNYTVTINPANTNKFSITVRAITVTPDALSKVYGSPDPTFTYTPSEALLSGNSFTGVLSRVAGENVVDGPYNYNIGTLTAGSNYSVTINPANTNKFTITPQTANPVGDTYYSGANFYWTTSATSKTATLALSATIKNNPNYTGDIRTAKVSFFIRNSPTSLTPISGAQNLPVGLVTPGNLNMGTAAVNLQYSITTHTILQIAVKISGNYTNDAGENLDGLIEIAIPTPGGLIAGCARLCNTNSTGYLKGATTCQTGTVKADASFFVQYNKSLANPQGKVYLTIRSYNDKNGNVTNVLHTYKVKSTAISVLATTSPTAQFSGKANLTEIVNGVEVNIEGGSQIQLALYDRQAPLQNSGTDSLGITIFRAAGGVWYSNNWIGNKTQNAELCNGDVSVTGTGGQTIATPSVVDESTRIDNIAPGTFKVRAFPNPTTHTFTLDVQSSSNEPIEVKVFDLTGHMVYYNKGSLKEAHHKFGQMLTNGTYITEIIQGTNRKTITLIKK